MVVGPNTPTFVSENKMMLNHHSMKTKSSAIMVLFTWDLVYFSNRLMNKMALFHCEIKTKSSPITVLFTWDEFFEKVP